MRGGLCFCILWKNKRMQLAFWVLWKNKRMQLAFWVCSMFNCLIFVDPVGFSFFPKDGIFTEHFFKGNGLDILQRVSRFAKVYSTWFLLILIFSISAVLWETFMEGSFSFPNVDEGGTLFTCDFVYDILSFAIDRGSYVIWRICVVADVFFGDAHGGKRMSGTGGWITFTKTGYHTIGPFWGQFGSD